MNGFWINPLNLPVPSAPDRIISLVPSQTELLADLGLDERVIGITKFCVHPQLWFRNKARVGGTKQLNLERVRQLKPDLILANKEENLQQDILAVARIAPVHVSDVYNLKDALEMIRTLGQLTATDAAAENLTKRISAAFSMLEPSLICQKAAYLIWRAPWMVAGSSTFIDDMLGYAGFRNVFRHLSRYPELDLETLQKANPDCILLSSEPYPFQEKHRAELARHLPEADIRLVDGELFSWYGSRLLLSAAYFRKLRGN